MPNLVKMFLLLTIIFPFIITMAAIVADFLFGGKIMLIKYVFIFLGWAITGMISVVMIYIFQKRRADQY
ncbi:MAG: hypothetical protein ACQEWV_27340 [Bacillota bacterium]